MADMSVDFGQQTQQNMEKLAEKGLSKAAKAIWERFKSMLSPSQQENADSIMEELAHNESLQIRDGSIELYEGETSTDIGIRINGEDYGSLHATEDNLTLNLGSEHNVEMDNINRLVDDPKTSPEQVIDESKMLNNDSVTQNLENLKEQGASGQDMATKLRNDALTQGRADSINANELVQTKDNGLSISERFNNMKVKASIEVPENFHDMGQRAKDLGQNISEGIQNPFKERADAMKDFSKLKEEAQGLKREINDLQRIHPEDKSKLLELEGKYEDTLSKAQEAYNNIPSRMHSIRSAGKNMGEAVHNSGQELYKAKIEKHIGNINNRLANMKENTLQHAQKGWNGFKADISQLKHNASLSLESAKNKFITNMENKHIAFEKNNLIREENMLGKDVEKYNSVFQKAKLGQNERFTKDWSKEVKRHPEYFKDGQLTPEGQQAQAACFDKNAFSPKDRKLLNGLKENIDKRVGKCNEKLDFLSKKGVDVKDHAKLVDNVSKVTSKASKEVAQTAAKTAGKAVEIGAGTASGVATFGVSTIATFAKEALSTAAKAVEKTGEKVLEMDRDR